MSGACALRAASYVDSALHDRLTQLKEHLGTIRTDGDMAVEQRNFTELVLGAEPDADPARNDEGGDDVVASDGGSACGDAQ